MVALGYTPAQALGTIMIVSDYTNGFVLQEQTVIGPPGEAEQAALPHLPTLLAALRQATATASRTKHSGTASGC